MIGGAIGDALGYAVEFSSENEIFGTYGPDGITEYKLSGGKALISDDTQMSLFTANGILVGETRFRMRGIGGEPSGYVPNAYQDWMKTQFSDIRTVSKYERYTKEGGFSWSWMYQNCMREGHRAIPAFLLLKSVQKWTIPAILSVILSMIARAAVV